jgi:hypothetical protein
MSIITIEAEIMNIDGILKAVERADQGHGLKYAKEAIRSATVDLIQRTWIAYAQGAPVSYSGGTFRVNSVTGSYVRSIQDGLRFPDDLTGEVFTTSPHGKLIEDGIEPFDMKSKMLASPKVRRGKTGTKYITIPFRIGTPKTVTMQAMPTSVYNQAKNLSYSRRGGTLQGGKSVYKWGGRLGSSGLGQRTQIGGNRMDASGRGYTWKTGQYSGMVKMGQKGHTQYMTFRRLSENSDPRSWQHPGVKPRPIRKAVVENTRKDVLALVRSGFEMDLYFMGLGGDGK